MRIKQVIDKKKQTKRKKKKNVKGLRCESEMKYLKHELHFESAQTGQIDWSVITFLLLDSETCVKQCACVCVCCSRDRLVVVEHAQLVIARVCTHPHRNDDENKARVQPEHENRTKSACCRVRGLFIHSFVPQALLVSNHFFCFAFVFGPCLLIHRHLVDSFHVSRSFFRSFDRSIDRRPPLSLFVFVVACTLEVFLSLPLPVIHRLRPLRAGRPSTLPQSSTESQHISLFLHRLFLNQYSLLNWLYLFWFIFFNSSFIIVFNLRFLFQHFSIVFCVFQHTFFLYLSFSSLFRNLCLISWFHICTQWRFFFVGTKVRSGCASKLFSFSYLIESYLYSFDWFMHFIFVHFVFAESFCGQLLFKIQGQRRWPSQFLGHLQSIIF